MSTASQSTALPLGASLVSMTQSEVLGGIILDTPDVVFDATPWRRWLHQLLVYLNVDLTYGDFDRAWSQKLLDVYQGQRDFETVLHSFLREQGLTRAQVDEVEAASRIKRKFFENRVRSFPGISRVLEELNRRNVPLIGWADTLYSATRWAERLDHIVPRVHFSVVLTSFDLGCTQPDAGCYHALCEIANRPAHELMFVSHDTAHLAAAASRGFQTVGYNTLVCAEAKHLLNNFEELLSVAEHHAAMPKPHISHSCHVVNPDRITESLSMCATVGAER